MAESNRKDNFDEIESNPKTTGHRARSKKNISWSTFLIPILFFIGISLFLMDYGKNNQQIDSPPSVNPQPITTTFIIEFDDQSIPVECRAYDYDYYRIQWNGTIKIIKAESEFDYIKNSGYQLVIPEFYAFLDTDIDRYYKYDNTECIADSKFFYNLTISGKTITNSFYIRPEDCNKIQDCGITERLKEILN